MHVSFVRLLRTTIKLPLPFLRIIILWLNEPRFFNFINPSILSTRLFDFTSATNFFFQDVWRDSILRLREQYKPTVCRVVFSMKLSFSLLLLWPLIYLTEVSDACWALFFCLKAISYLRCLKIDVWNVCGAQLSYNALAASNVLQTQDRLGY